MTYSDLIFARLPAAGSYWLLDEASGNVTDSGGGAHNSVSVAGSPAYRATGPMGSTTGELTNYAIGTFVSSDGFDCGDIFEFTGLATFSVECWFMPTIRDAAARYLMSQRQGGAEGWDWLVEGSSATRFRRFQASALDDCNMTTLPSLFTWSYMVATYDASNIRLYINAQNLATLASTKSIQANTATFQLCGGGPGALGGYQARPVVSPGVVLTPEQIADAYRMVAYAPIGRSTEFLLGGIGPF